MSLSRQRLSSGPSSNGLAFLPFFGSSPLTKRFQRFRLDRCCRDGRNASARSRIVYCGQQVRSMSGLGEWNNAGAHWYT